MTLLKLPPSPTRLAELAVENGWPAEEVTRVLVKMTGPVGQSVTPSVSSSKVGAGSNVVHEEFARVHAQRC